MNKVPSLTQKLKFQLLKKEVTKLISKNENKLIFDDKLELLFNTLVDESAITDLIQSTDAPGGPPAKNNKSFNWSQYFQRENNPKSIHTNIERSHAKKERSTNVHRDNISTSQITTEEELELEKYEYMVFDTITETSWKLKVIDFPRLKIKKETSIFTIINENNFRDPFQVMSNISRCTAKWEVFGTNGAITTQIVLRRRI